MGGNAWPTIKLEAQLTRTARLTAAGLGPCENNSDTISHGMDPGITVLKYIIYYNQYLRFYDINFGKSHSARSI